MVAVHGCCNMILLTSWLLFELCCLLKPGLSKDIQCHVSTYAFLPFQITRTNIGLQVNWAASLVIANGHFQSSSGICMVMYEYTYLITRDVLHGWNLDKHG